jgi:hypothetical protein
VGRYFLLTQVEEVLFQFLSEPALKLGTDLTWGSQLAFFYKIVLGTARDSVKVMNDLSETKETRIGRFFFGHGYSLLLPPRKISNNLFLLYRTKRDLKANWLPSDRGYPKALR